MMKILLSLGGCVTMAEQIDNTCRNYGFHSGTEAFANCRMQVDQQKANSPASPGRGLAKAARLCGAAPSR
jgi:hypothetical protein